MVDPNIRKQNLRNYVINTNNIDDPEYIQNRAETLRYWARQRRDDAEAKNKEASPDSDYDSEVDSLLNELTREDRDLGDYLPKLHTPIECRAIDPITGRCLNAINTGCFGDEDGGLFGC